MNRVSALASRARGRTWRDVLASVLDCLTKGNATQNKVMTSVNQNVDATRNYLRDLISWGFVNVAGESRGRKIYSITEKGKEWLRMYKSLLALEGSRD